MGDVREPGALKLRTIIKQIDQQFPSKKKLHPGNVAADGVIETTYIEYARLSLDAVHCSVTALGRHLSQEGTHQKVQLVVSVIPRTRPSEATSTILHACRALMGTAVGANELLGFTSASGDLEALVTEFEANSWNRRD